MSLNADLVRTRCTEIDESLRRLERFKSLSLKDFLSNEDTLDLTCYRLLVAIEAALALCYHISAKRLRKVPEEYAECFKVLAEAGVVRDELSVRLQKMARFRNVLVHMYWKIDYHQVYEILQHNLDDLREFCAAVTRLL